MDFLNDIEGLTDEQKAAISNGVNQVVETNTATTNAQLESLKQQIAGLEDIKVKSKVELQKREEELAKASGDYTKVIESKEAEWNERFQKQSAELEGLKKSTAEGQAKAAAAKVVSIFTESSRTMADLAAKSLVNIERTDDGEYGVKYTLPGGETAADLDALIEGIKKSDDFSAHIRAETSKGGPAPKGKEKGGYQDLKDKGQRRSNIKDKYNLNS